MNKSDDLAMMLKRVIRMGRRVGISDVPFTSLLDSADSLLDRTGMQGSPLRSSPPPVASGELPELPEWSKQDDLGGLVPSEIRTAIVKYARQAIASRDARIAELDADLSAAREESK